MIQIKFKTPTHSARLMWYRFDARFLLNRCVRTSIAAAGRRNIYFSLPTVCLLFWPPWGMMMTLMSCVACVLTWMWSGGNNIVCTIGVQTIWFGQLCKQCVFGYLGNMGGQQTRNLGLWAVVDIRGCGRLGTARHLPQCTCFSGTKVQILMHWLTVEDLTVIHNFITFLSNVQFSDSGWQVILQPCIERDSGDSRHHWRSFRNYWSEADLVANNI